jgi:hypothetical protein
MRQAKKTNVKVNTSIPGKVNDVVELLNEIAYSSTFPYSGDNSNMNDRKTVLHWIERIGLYIVQQAPSFKFLTELIQGDTTVDIFGWIGRHSGYWTYPQQPSESELRMLRMLRSEVVDGKFRILAWAAAFIHRKTIGNFLNIPEDVHAFVMLAYSVHEQVATANWLRSSTKGSELNSAKISAVFRLSVFIGVMFSRTNWLDDGE